MITTINTTESTPRIANTPRRCGAGAAISAVGDTASFGVANARGTGTGPGGIDASVSPNGNGGLGVGGKVGSPSGAAVNV